MEQTGDGVNILRTGDQLSISFHPDIKDHITWAFDQIRGDDSLKVEKNKEEGKLIVMLKTQSIHAENILLCNQHF